MRCIQTKSNNSNGYSIIEMMVAMVIASIMSLAVLSIYINQTTHLAQENQRDNSSQEANRSFDLISRLLRQANQQSINITYPGSAQLNSETTAEIANDGINVDFSLPAGFNIWPNDVAPYENNNIRIKWDNDSNSNASYIVQIANSDSVDNIASKALKSLAGTNQGEQPRIVNLDLWPLADQRNLQNSVTKIANNGYLLRVTTRTANKDMSYNNPNFADDSPLKHYRTYTVSGIISPRN